MFVLLVVVSMKHAGILEPHRFDPNKSNPDAVPSFYSACRHRAFFITANGYFGVGRRDASVGDEIHILSGTHVPFILRREVDERSSIEDEVMMGTRNDEDADMPLYRMVGETYVHGIMKGGALERDGFEWGGIQIG